MNTEDEGPECVCNELTQLRTRIGELESQLEEAVNNEAMRPCCKAGDCIDSQDGRYCSCSGCYRLEKAESAIAALQLKWTDMLELVEGKICGYMDSEEDEKKRKGLPYCHELAVRIRAL